MRSGPRTGSSYPLLPRTPCAEGKRPVSRLMRAGTQSGVVVYARLNQRPVVARRCASGPVNVVLRKLGLVADGVNFLGDPKTALWTVVAVYIWKWFGVTLIYWLAALQTVPDEVYEAAAIDGAGPWGLLRHVTFRLLKPFAVIITLLTLESTLKVFDLMLTMTNGGPFYATEVVEIYIYRWAFAATVPELGFASAAAVIFGLFVGLLGVLQLVGIRAARNARSAA